MMLILAAISILTALRFRENRRNVQSSRTDPEPGMERAP
jgi:hypothetical protein